jgi:hypothetical protein
MNPTDLSNIETKVDEAIKLYNSTTGNFTKTSPPVKPTNSNNDSGLFEESKVFGTYFLQNLKTNTNGSISGDFLVINQGETLSQSYPAKLYVRSVMSNIELATFTVGTNNRGTFTTQPDTVNSLKAIQNRQTFEIVFIIKVDAFPNITYDESLVLLPIGCPDLGFKTNDLIEPDFWKEIEQNICCECYSKPYTGTQVTWKDQNCSKNGTTPCD